MAKLPEHCSGKLSQLLNALALQAREGGWHMGGPRFSTPVVDGTTPRGVDLVEHGACLATTGRGNGRGNGGQLEMPQDTRDHRLLGDDGNDAQGAPSAKRTGAHLQPKDAAQEPGPRPVRGARLRLPVHTLLAWRREDAPAQVAVRRQTAAIAHQVAVR